MRASFFTILFAVLNLAAETPDADQSFSVSVAVPVQNGERRIEYRNRSTHFHVIVTNTSEKPQRLWREWCSWGYFGLSFEFSGYGKKWIAKRKPRDWTINYPDWWTLGPHESLILDVHFGDPDIWEGFPHPEHGFQEVTMQAVFEFRPDDESRTHSVWTGRALSKADTFVFYQATPETK